MLTHFSKTPFFRLIAISVIAAFVAVIPVQSGYAQVAIQMPMPGTMLRTSAAIQPALMLGLKVDLKDPFNFYFIMDEGQRRVSDEIKKGEYEKLIKYFMASLTIPNEDMWVNLSPLESNRIIPDNFAKTEMGRDLLAQDYILKQLTSTLMYPEDATGKAFWKKLYQAAYDKYGTTEIPIDTFNKVWIVPNKADIYQKDDTSLLVDSHLKVMLEQDFMAVDQNKAQFGHVGAEAVSGEESRKIASDIVRDVIVPVIEQEVNTGENFAAVRQAYSAMIMAVWFKKTLKASLLGQVYADKSKVKGVETKTPEDREKIYQQYLQAYKVGVFNYIKEEADPVTLEMLPRKYFSGGLTIDASQVTGVDQRTAIEKMHRNPGFVARSKDVIKVGMVVLTLAGAALTPSRALADTVAQAKEQGKPEQAELSSSQLLARAGQEWTNTKADLNDGKVLGVLGNGAQTILYGGSGITVRAVSNGAVLIEDLSQRLGNGVSVIYQKGKLWVQDQRGEKKEVTGNVFVKPEGEKAPVLVSPATKEGEERTWSWEKNVSPSVKLAQERLSAQLDRIGQAEREAWSEVPVVMGDAGRIALKIVTLGGIDLPTYVQRLEDEVLMQTRNVRNLEPFVSKFRIQLEEAKQKLETAGVDAEKVRQEITGIQKNLDDALAQMKQERDAHTSEIEGLLADIGEVEEALEEAIAASMKKETALEEAAKKIADLHRTIEAQQIEIDSLWGTIFDLDRQLQQAVDKVDELTREVAAANAATAQAQQETTRSNWIAVGVGVMAALLGGAWFSKRRVARNLLKAKHVAEGQAATLQAQVADLTAQLEGKERQHVQEIERLKQAAQGELAAVQRNFSEAQDSIAALQGQLTQFNNDLVAKSAQMAALVTKSGQDAQQARQQIDEALANARDLQARLTEREQNARALEVRIEDIQRQSGEQLALTQGEVDRLRGDLERAMTDREALTADLQKMRDNVSRIQSEARVSLETAQNRISQLQEEAVVLARQAQANAEQNVVVTGQGALSVGENSIVAAQAVQEDVLTLAQLQETRLEHLTELGKNIASVTYGGAILADEWKSAKRRVAAQIGAATRRMTWLNEQGFGDKKLDEVEKILEAEIASMKGKKDLRAELSRTRSRLARVRTMNILTKTSKEDVVAAVMATPRELLSQLSDPQVVERLAADHPQDAPQIRSFARLTKAQKVALLKATLAQLQAENILLASENAEDLVAVEKEQKVAEAIQEFSKKVDASMLDALKKGEPLGGINLSDANLTINIRLDGAGMPLPVQLQDPAMMDLQGLSPIIREIVPMTPQNVPVLSELMALAGSSSV